MREIWGEDDDAATLPLPRVIERIHPEDRARVATAIEAALAPASSGLYEIDYRIVWNDGTQRWISANGKAQFEGEAAFSHPVGFIGTALDITERKRVEQDLRDSETRFRLIVESARDYAIIALDLQGYITSWNVGAQRLLGYEESEIVGQIADIIFTPEDRVNAAPETEKHLALTQGRALAFAKRWQSILGQWLNDAIAG